MQAELVERAGRRPGRVRVPGRVEHRRLLRASPTGSCAIRIGPRTRPSRHCSGHGVTCRRSATSSGSTPGCIASSSTPATPRPAANAVMVARVRLLQTDLPTSPDVARSVAARDDLDHAFRQLSPEQRAVVVLHHHLGYPLTEIAATLGIPVGTARSRLHYAVRQLRIALDASDRSLASSQERPA